MIIFDIDGVLADNSHRQHFYDEGNRDKFYDPEEVMKDSLIIPTAHLINGLSMLGWYIVLLSSRRDNLKITTLEWLEKNTINYHELIVRPKNDHLIRGHAAWKAEVLQNLDTKGDGRVFAFYDNEDNNLEAACKVLGRDRVFKLCYYSN